LTFAVLPVASATAKTTQPKPQVRIVKIAKTPMAGTMRVHITPGGIKEYKFIPNPGGIKEY
jgi:hypothetical protein